MNKQISILAIEFPHERHIARVLFMVLAVLLCGYLYCVGASVLNIIARKEASAQTSQLQSSIAYMEQQYFALSQGIDRSGELSLGLAPVSGTQYVYRPGNAASAAIATRNEI